MSDLYEDLRRRAARFEPRVGAYERVLRRVSRRRLARRVTSGVTAILIAAAALTGLWSVTRTNTMPAASPRPSPTPTAGTEFPYDGLQIGLRTRVDGWVVLADGSGVWVAGNGLYGVNPKTGVVRKTAQGTWDYDYVRLAEHGDGMVWVVSGGTLSDVDTRSRTTKQLFNLSSLGTIDNVYQASSGTTWVAADGQHGNVLARINPDNGKVLERYDVGQGFHQITEAGGYLFVASQNSSHAIIRIDLRTGGEHPGPRVWSGWLGVVGIGDRLWIEEGQDVHCVEAASFAPCSGQILIPRGQQLATDGRSLWVLSGTGSKSSSRYIPDPNQPATVTMIDGTTGEVLGGPIGLPDATPATISAYDGHAWVGFHDTGRLLRIDRCAPGSCTTRSK